jgi:NarL family two-component system response regulator LiaR
MEAGAVSYNLKNMKMEWLADELRRVSRGEWRLHPRVATLMLQKIGNERGSESPSFSFIELTNRELDVLKYIANGMTHSQIAEELGISKHIVKSHVSNILSKLYLADYIQAAFQARLRV